MAASSSSTILKVGDKFDSVDEVFSVIKLFEDEQLITYWRRHTRLLESGPKSIPGNDKIRYYQVNFHCLKGGKKHVSSSKGKRPNQRMESDENSATNWAVAVSQSDAHFEPFNTAADQVLPPGPQATLQGFTTTPFSGNINDASQLQQLTAGPFHAVYPPQGYERISPIHADYPSSSGSPAGQLLQQLQAADSRGLGRPILNGYQQVQMLLGGIGDTQPAGVESQQTSSLMLTGDGHAAAGLYVIADTGRDALTTTGVTPAVVAIQQDATQQAQQPNQPQLYSVVNIPVSTYMDGSTDRAPMVIRPASNSQQVVNSLEMAMRGEVMTAAGFASQAGRLHASDVNNFAHLPIADASNAFVVPDSSQMILDQLTSRADHPAAAGVHDLAGGMLTDPLTALIPLHPPGDACTQDDDSLSEMLADNSLGTHQLSTNNLHANTYKADDNTRSILIQPQQQPHVRKSKRIAELEKEMVQSVPPREYVHDKYNVDEIWCDDCQMSYEDTCPRHQKTSVYDKVVLSRAWASLPSNLQIFRFADTPELGVFAKKSIPKRTQFGPFVAVLTQNQETLNNPKFLLMLERDNGCFYLETTDENHCNWMMFVRPATNYSEQNLVAYQHGTEIYFTTIKSIDVRHELKVWYASHYAHQMGVKTHEVSEADMKVLVSADLKWECTECDEKFRTSALLQLHLQVHDDTTTGTACADSEEGSDAKADGSTRGVKNNRTLRVTRAANGTFQSWKKRLYFNKVKKYTRGNAATSDASRRPLYRQRRSDHGGDTGEGGGGGGQEWLCSHCDLTFDNASVLNLHTLTHAAEDVDRREAAQSHHDAAGDGAGLLLGVGGVLAAGSSVGDGDGMRIAVIGASNGDVNGEIAISASESSQQPPQHACPVCARVFACKQQLIEHASEHARPQSSRHANHTSAKPYKCSHCWKAFSISERLARHMLCHGDERTKPVKCDICGRRLMNNSALACHLKTHSAHKYYECPLCRAGFDQMHALRAHTDTHRDAGGQFACTVCAKVYPDYPHIRKHMRMLHSGKQFPCPVCNKMFPRPDKLKLHMLRHSTHREFMCENCGQQFKRNDKLKEHTRRMHHPDREAHVLTEPVSTIQTPVRKFIPRVSPNDYERFIYKCHTCRLGFKRRGMLVNHLAKRHPGVTPDSVPELNLPILRTQRDYYCQYCDKVYKSSSKRKAHILKIHPGAELPANARRHLGSTDSILTDIDMVSTTNPTFSQTVGSVTTVPHGCEFCHKQYASKAKLLQHQRKKHVSPQLVNRRPINYCIDKTKLLGGLVVPSVIGEKCESAVDVMASMQATDAMPVPDLLSQAMSELQQSMSEFRPVGQAEYQRLLNAGVLLQPQSLDLSHMQMNATSVHSFLPMTTTTATTSAVANEQTAPPAQYMARAWPTGHV